MKPGLENKAKNIEVIENIIKRMMTILKSPESKIIIQDDTIKAGKDHMFFIAKGKCKVVVRDKFIERYES